MLVMMIESGRDARIVTDLDVMVRAGTILEIEYSGPKNKTHFSHQVMVLKSFRKRDVVEAFKMACVLAGTAEGDIPSCDFTPWLVRSGYADIANVRKWSIGGYRFDP